MSNTYGAEPRDLGLWRRYSGGAQEPGGPESIPDADPGGLDPLTLAAYLDGTLSQAEREQVEALLTERPEDLECALAARDALGDHAGPAPDSLVARACALVPERRALIDSLLRRVARSAVGPLAAPARSRRAAAWSAAAAIVLLACGLGFQLGQTGYAGALSVERHLAQDLGPVLGQPAEDFL